MNRFRTNSPETPEDELIALHLGELSPAHERTLRRKLKSDPALQADSDAIARTLTTVKDTPMQADAAALDRAWNALRPALMPYAAAGISMSPWRILLLAGFALVGIYTVAAHLSRRPAAPQPQYRHSVAPPEASPRRSIPAEHPPSFTNRTGPEAPTRQQPAPRVPMRFALLPEPSGTPAIAPYAGPAVELHAPAVPFNFSPAIHASLLSPEPLPTAAALPLPAPTTLPANGSDAPLSEHAHARTRTRRTMDVSIGFGADVTALHRSVVAGTETKTFTASPSMLLLGSFHQQIRPAVGYRLTASYTRPDYHYDYFASGALGFDEAGAIHTNIIEGAGTYVFNGPHVRRVKTSIETGAGLMAFVPSGTPHASCSYRAAGIVGASADYPLTKHLGIRLSYRAQIFRTPDFRYNGGAIPVTTSLVGSHEPSLGVTYTFGKK